jgi:hypothetical protein
MRIMTIVNIDSGAGLFPNAIHNIYFLSEVNFET